MVIQKFDRPSQSGQSKQPVLVTCKVRRISSIKPLHKPWLLPLGCTPRRDALLIAFLGRVTLGGEDTARELVIARHLLNATQ